MLPQKQKEGKEMKKKEPDALLKFALEAAEACTSPVVTTFKCPACGGVAMGQLLPDGNIRARCRDCGLSAMS